MTTQLDMFAGPPPRAATREGDTVADAVSPPALHDKSPTVRASDPVTSRDYGDGGLGRNRQCARVLRVIAKQGAHGATCADVVEVLRSDRGNTSRRITDLTQRGLIRADGTTRTTPAGRRQVVHYVTAAGLRAVADLRVAS